MVCHGELADARPSTIHLTEFYLWLSVGGVLGGLFNALLAPVIFKALTEYPLMIAVACLLRPASGLRTQKPNARYLDFIIPFGSALILIILVLGISNVGLGHLMRLDDSTSDWDDHHRVHLVLHCRYIVRLLGTADSLWAGYRSRDPGQLPLGQRAQPGAVFRAQFFRYAGSDARAGRGLPSPESRNNDPRGTEPQPRSPLRTPYLLQPHRPGRQVFEAFDQKPNKDRVAVIGLGTGTLACYAQPGQHWVFYEIDPIVARIAHDPLYFTFLDDCAAEVDVILGDGRYRWPGRRTVILTSSSWTFSAQTPFPFTS